MVLTVPGHHLKSRKNRAVASLYFDSMSYNDRTHSTAGLQKIPLLEFRIYFRLLRTEPNAFIKQRQHFFHILRGMTGLLQ